MLDEQRGDQGRALADIIAEPGGREVAGDGRFVDFQPFSDRRHGIGRAGCKQEELGQRRAFGLPAAEAAFLLGGESGEDAGNEAGRAQACRARR